LSDTANENMHPPLDENGFVELAEDGKVAAKLRLEFANGNRFFFPYAYMLQVEYINTKGELKLYTAQKEITIKGRGLDQLEELLYDNVVKTIKQSKIALVKEKSLLFVRSIEVVDRFEE
ncbi:MAG: hypothetical protein AAGG68_24525, partial [Bacteroidota bacterium]